MRVYIVGLEHLPVCVLGGVQYIRADVAREKVTELFSCGKLDKVDYTRRFENEGDQTGDGKNYRTGR